MAQREVRAPDRQGLAAAALSQRESPHTPREYEVLAASRQHPTVADLAEAVRVAEEKGWL
jgi:hypothetical protein